MAWPGLAYAHPEAVRQWSQEFLEHAAPDEETLARNRAVIDSLHGAVRDLAEADVDLLVSSSGGWFLVPGFSIHVELRCLDEAGLTPEQILRAATLNAARSVDQQALWGSITPGKAADLVLLEANPLVDVRNAERVSAVVRRGVLHDRADLDRRLDRIQATWSGVGE